MSAPTENLVRAWAGPEAVAVRSDDDEGSTMVGRFAVFNQWTEIRSSYEGHFLERIAPGAFAKTFEERGDKIRVLYDHGADPSIGNKPLGQINVLREDGDGAYYEVGLFDASYVNDLKPALRAGQLGASFRFRVTGEEWNDSPQRSDSNPDRLPERTITGADVPEFGPVTFPAYAGASASMRSRTDEFLDHFLNDPAFVARFRERVGPAVVDKIRASIPPTVDAGEPAVEAPAAPAAVDPVEVADGDVREDPQVADGDVRVASEDLERRQALLRRRTSAFDAHIERLKESQS
jgi:HK97 family phage prohead protease